VGENKELEKNTSLVEAVLYLESEPIDEAGISSICGISKEAVQAALENLKERYDAGEGAFELSRISGKIMITVKREYWEQLKERYGRRNEGKFSRAAMETLAIVAYKQPITRAEIEKIRGVNADNMIRLLFEKELVAEAGKKDIPGRPAMYKTTKNFLKLFGLNSIADLPKLSESDLEKFELVGEKY
jgi:segregation and condensation protein B